MTWDNMTKTQRLIWLKTLSGGGGTVETVTGAPPLELKSAASKPIKSLIQYGYCTQDATPSPDNPQPIKCNNGILVARHESGLPTSYTLLENIYNGSNTRVTMTYDDDVDDMVYEIKVKPSLGSWYILQSRQNASAPIYGISGSGTGNTINFGVGSALSLTSDIVRDETHTYIVRGEHKNGVATLYVKDVTADEEDTQTATYTGYTAATTTIGLFGNGSNYVAANNYVEYVKLWKSGTLVQHLVPVKTSANTICFYNFATELVKTAADGTLNGGDPANDPVVVYVEGTPETIFIGQGMAEVSSLPSGYELMANIKVPQNRMSGAILNTEVYLANVYAKDTIAELKIKSEYESGLGYSDVHAVYGYDDENSGYVTEKFGRYYAENSEYPLQSISSTAYNPLTVEIYHTSGSSHLYIRNENDYSTASASEYPALPDGRLVMFKTPGVGGERSTFSGYCYGVKVWQRTGYQQKGSLIYNGVPAKETATGKCGLYDLVSDTFNGTTDITGTPFEYVAHAEALFGYSGSGTTGNDYQDLISGEVNRSWKAIVLDGTEKYYNDGTSAFPNRKRIVVDNLNSWKSAQSAFCTHYPKGTAQIAGTGTQDDHITIYATDATPTAADLQAFVAQQYAAGTPLIVVYRYTQPTTTVEGQRLKTTEGDDFISVVAEVHGDKSVQYVKSNKLGRNSPIVGIGQAGYAVI